MSDQAQRHRANMQENLGHSLYFLRLTVEQLRILSPEAATRLTNIHIPALLREFDNATATKAIGVDSASTLDALTTEGNEAMTRLSKIAGKAPPGFGGIVTGKMAEISSAQVTNPFGVIGGERKKKISEVNEPAKKRSMLRDLVEESERDDVLSTVKHKKEAAVGVVPTHLKEPPANKQFYATSSSAKSGSGEIAEAVRSGGSAEEVFTPPQAESSPPQRPQVPTAGSWAKVANLAPQKRIKNTAAPSTAFSGHLLPASAVPSLSLHPLRRSASSHGDNTTSRPRASSEPLLEQYRALYLGNLPTGTTLAAVSALITTGGPLMSLMLTTDTTEAMPGLSCCIIFKSAADCHVFLQANAPIGVKVAWPPIEGVPHSALLFSKLATEGETYIMPAGPYSDPDTKLMDTAPFPRRRIKFTKKGLFHDLPISTFKRDILALLGGGNEHFVELCHFYNAGECTIVFASVRVAVTVKESFERWCQGIPEAILKGKSNAVAMGISQAELQLMGRYAGVEASFAHDFNEKVDQPLWTTFEWVEEEGFTGVGRTTGSGGADRGRVFREPGQRGYRSVGQAIKGLWQGPKPAAAAP